jgi:hypothetical protein
VHLHTLLGDDYAHSVSLVALGVNVHMLAHIYVHRINLLNRLRLVQPVQLLFQFTKLAIHIISKLINLHLQLRITIAQVASSIITSVPDTHPIKPPHHSHHHLRVLLLQPINIVKSPHTHDGPTLIVCHSIQSEPSLQVLWLWLLLSVVELSTAELLVAQLLLAVLRNLVARKLMLGTARELLLGTARQLMLGTAQVHLTYHRLLRL